MNEPRIIAGPHLRAKPDGRVLVRVSGDGPATVTLRSARRVTPRWLAGATRPRLVRFGTRSVDLRPGAVATVAFQLSADQLALLHRMQTMRAAIRLQTHGRVLTRRVDLHPPRRDAVIRRRAGADVRRRTGRQAGRS